MKSNNKRPLISCIAFVCKNTDSADASLGHLTTILWENVDDIHSENKSCFEALL